MKLKYYHIYNGVRVLYFYIIGVGVSVFMSCHGVRVGVYAS